MFGGSKLGSPVTSGVTRRQSRVYFLDCKVILTHILRTWVQKSTLLLQNRVHTEVLKKTPSSAKYVTRVLPPSVPECPRRAYEGPLAVDQIYLDKSLWYLIRLLNLQVFSNRFIKSVELTYHYLLYRSILYLHNSAAAESRFASSKAFGQSRFEEFISLR